ncbi:hypothetical protein AKO1_010844, partial [Acrasis kona]
MDDGFVLVKTKRNASDAKKVKLAREKQMVLMKENSYDVFDAVKFCGKIKQHMEEIKDSPFFTELVSTITKCVGNESFSLVSFGIGDMIDSNISQYQSACLILLSKHFNTLTNELYDPVMVMRYEALLPQVMDAINQNFETTFKWINKNEECKRQVSQKTLFFMPHCSLKMYLNLIQHNLNTLNLLLILGNSFSNYVDRDDTIAPFTLLAENTHEKSFDALVTKKKKNAKSNLHDCFNDTSLHWFDAITDMSVIETIKSDKSIDRFNE